MDTLTQLQKVAGLHMCVYMYVYKNLHTILTQTKTLQKWNLLHFLFCLFITIVFKSA